MSLKIEDVKPGDIVCYSNEWYCLITRKIGGAIDFLWLSGNSRPDKFNDESFRLSSDVININDLLERSIKLTRLDIHILIGELEKLKNDNRT